MNLFIDSVMHIYIVYFARCYTTKILKYSLLVIVAHKQNTCKLKKTIEK